MSIVETLPYEPSRVQWLITYHTPPDPLVRKDDAQRKAEAKLAIKIKQDKKDGTVDVEVLPPAEQGEELQGASGGIRKT